MQSLGPPNARIAIVGDYPTGQEVVQGKPFSSWAGGKFQNLLSRAGLLWNNCYVTLIAQTHPPKGELGSWMSERKTCPGPGWEKFGDAWLDPVLIKGINRVQAELARVNPDIIIITGNVGLLALTGNTGISKWRGSRLGSKPVILPTLPAETLVTQPELAMCIQMDLTRARLILEGKQTPREYSFKIEPTFGETYAALDSLLRLASIHPLLLSGDLETRSGHIACFGIAWSAVDAICIPLLLAEGDKQFYWTEEEETLILELVAKLFRHPNILWTGQNFSYDCQYFWRHWGILPSRVYDTMIGHHAIHSNTRKGLDFLSSIYAHDHVYWKDEIKEWDAKIGEHQYWIYNCKDSCITWEITHEIQESAKAKGLQEHADFQQSLFFPVLRMMNRGIRIDKNQRMLLSRELTLAGFQRQETLNLIAGHELNPKSPTQLVNFFYHDLGIPGIKNLATDSLTTNSPAISLISEREPILQPICQLIVELRSIGVFLSTFIGAELDIDDRMRCSFAIAGPITYRFASRENAFGSGMNLQNIPVEEKQKVKSSTYIHLPNIRKLFIPDEGMTFFDMDLDRADLQVVVAEAEDEPLRMALSEGLDMHLFNAMAVFDLDLPLDELRENHPNYKEIKARYGKQRQLAKMAVHATNYGVGDRKLATSLGITTHEASIFRSKWFAAHPGIRRWHLRTEEHGTIRGYIENRFGARLYTLGRFNLPEALAWLPQSTVAGVINRALVNIDAAEQRGETGVQILIQVHDSLAGQFPTRDQDRELENLRSLARVEVPYAKPLVIPVGINFSTQSWGHCK